MYRHLDIRESPTLPGLVTGEQEGQMTFIACTQTHAAAVVDGTVRDDRDSRDLGDRWKHPADGRLTELWVACDDPTRDAIQDILKKYREMRRYDDVLTLGRSWRTA